MITLDQWWHRNRWTMAFAFLAVTLGGAIGIASALVQTLQVPYGHRSTFFVELFFAFVVGAIVLSLLVTHARVGLPILLVAVAILPARSSMQWQFSGLVIITATDVALLLGFLVLILHTKVLRRERLRPVVIRTPLWLWVPVGVVGLAVAMVRGVPWENYVPEVKAFYLWILTVILCVNIIRTRFGLRTILVIAVLAALPQVVLEYTSQSTVSTDAVLLSNGTVVYRTSGGAGVLNQYALYIVVMFFLALGLGMATRRWRPRLLYFGCAAFLLVGVVLTYTRGAWIGAAVGLLVLGAAGGRRVLAGLLVGCAIAYSLIPVTIWARLNFTDNSTAERLGYLHNALPTVQAYPLLGGGWGSNFAMVGNVLTPLFDANDPPAWHDDYLVVATQVGLIGLAVYLWIWGGVAWAALRARWRTTPGPMRTYLLALLAALAAMFTQAFTDNYIWRNESGPVIWLVFGLACAAINIVNDERQGPALDLAGESTQAGEPDQNRLALSQHSGLS